MTTTRIMSGLADLTGTKCATLRVERMISRQPEPKYSTICEQCSTRSTATHSRLRDGAARCMFSGCGKSLQKRGPDLLTEHRRLLAEHEDERVAEASKAAELRMAADVDSLDWESREADRVAAAELQADEARQAAEVKQRERDERKRAYDREWILSDRDPKLQVSDAMRNASMPTKKDVEDFTTRSAAQFAGEPEYAAYRTLDNADIILGYLNRNGIHIADVETIRAAFTRLRDLGILKTKATPIAAKPKAVNVTVTPETAKPVTGPKMYMGRDYATGFDRQFSEREINRMSSLEYQRAFDILPSVGQLFTAMSDAR